MAKPMTEEEYLHEQIRCIQEEYQRAIKPYVDRLVKIHSTRIDPIILPSFQITQEMLDNMKKPADF
jgi:hypothetical protein